MVTNPIDVNGAKTLVALLRGIADDLERGIELYAKDKPLGLDAILSATDGIQQLRDLALWKPEG